MLSEKGKFSYVDNHGPMSKNGLGLEYSHIFINREADLRFVFTYAKCDFLIKRLVLQQSLVFSLLQQNVWFENLVISSSSSCCCFFFLFF